MKYVFGPIPSRRLGQSLGVDPIPFKTCNWNCVYCQLGRTSPLINDRQDYFPPEDILAEIRQSLAERPAGSIDWITFVGSGEPTLHASLGRMIRAVKSETEVPVAVITNGSLLTDAAVREELQAADAVMPTVDAGNERLYLRLNRPLPQLDFDTFLRGLIDFREQYSGSLWVEVMLVRGLNDSEPALRELAEVLARIRPDAIHVNSPTRPACEPWVQPTDAAGLQRASEILGGAVQVVQPSHGEFELSGYEGVTDAVTAVIQRHPISEDELVQLLTRWRPGLVRESLAELERSGQAQVVDRGQQRFWSCAAARYVAPVQQHKVPTAAADEVQLVDSAQKRQKSN